MEKLFYCYITKMVFVEATGEFIGHGDIINGQLVFEDNTTR